MKKAMWPILQLMIIVHLLSACGSAEPTDALVVCGSHGVPGMFCFDLKGSTYECNILEEDSEGRTLYEYVAYSDITGQDESIVVICQHTDNRYVYYYEDQCYVVGDYQKADIEALKTLNDWGDTLNYSRMSRREVDITFDRCISFESVIKNKNGRSACAEALNIEMSQIKELCISDVDGFDHQ